MIRRIIAVILALSLVPLPSWATNTIVQVHSSGVVYDFGSGVTNTYSSAVTPGTLLVMAVPVTPSSVVSVSDPTNGNWTQDFNCTRTYDGFGNVIYSVHNTGNTALTVTIVAAPGTYYDSTIYEISGPPSTNYVDATASDNSNLQPSVTLTTVSAHDTVISTVLSYAIASASPGDTGFTLDHDDGFTYTSYESNADIGAASNYTLNFGNPSGNLQSNYECIEAIAYKTSGSPPPATATSTNLPMMGI